MIIIGIILLVVVAVVAFQNPIEVTVRFLQWSYPTSLGLALVAAGVVGAVLMYISGIFRQYELRAQVRSAEARLREVERQRQAAGNETQQTPRA